MIGAMLLFCVASTVRVAFEEQVVTAHADPGTTDTDTVFIATLDMFNVPYSSKADAITDAKALCLWYSANDTFFAMGAMEILKEHPSYTTADAGHFAGAATTAYCPKYEPSDS